MCKGVFPATSEHFGLHKNGSTKTFSSYCHPCNREKSREYGARNKARRSEYNKRRRSTRIGDYNYDAMLLEQDGRCAICRGTDPAHRWGQFQIDHDHSCCTGEKRCGNCNRGLLCSNCNMGLGRFMDNPDLIQAALTYLRRWNGTANANNPEEGLQRYPAA